MSKWNGKKCYWNKTKRQNKIKDVIKFKDVNKVCKTYKLKQAEQQKFKREK